MFSLQVPQLVQGHPAAASKADSVSAISVKSVDSHRTIRGPFASLMLGEGHDWLILTGTLWTG